MEVVITYSGLCLSVAVLEMGRYTIPELLSVPEFHTGTYQYVLYPAIFS
jgi:hypothetical protein